MDRSNRKRTTLTPGVVDLPRARRTTAEVSLEKKKKTDAATKKSEAKRLAAIQVAELEKQSVASRIEESSVDAPATKRSNKRPVARTASKDVSFFPIINQKRQLTQTAHKSLAASLSSEPTVSARTLSKPGMKRKAVEQPVAAATNKRKGGLKYVPVHSYVLFSQ
jgi:hypothetical protein